MNRLSILLTSLLAGGSVIGAGITYYVSPNGNDNNNGLSPATPFQSLTKAQLTVRQNNQRGLQPITVQLRQGVYQLTEPLAFTPEDSGSEAAPITWQSYPGERATISGGRVITGWKVEADGAWTVTIPEAVNGHMEKGKWNINQLFVNGERRFRCRMPKQPDFFRMNGRPYPWSSREEANKHNESYTQLVYHEKDIEPLFTKDGKRDPYDITNAQIVQYNSWTASIHNLSEIKYDDHRLVYTARVGWPIGYWDANSRYHIENVRAACTDPGEWYMDYHTGTLRYIPKPGETPENTTVVAPVIQQIVTITGDTTAGLPAQYINLDNLDIAYGTYPMMHSEGHEAQAACYLEGSVRLKGAMNCRLTRLLIAHVGIYGLQIGKGSRYNTVDQCELTDLGGGGIRVGETGGDTDPHTGCAYNTVDNCFIHNGGLIDQAAVGYIVYKSSYNTLRHSEICDMYYSAVSMGWSWGYAPSTANHNIVEYCHLHHLGYGILSDMGAVYNLGISPGTIVRGNLIHDVFSYSYGGWGLYTDEGSTDVIMENNVVYNTKSGGFHQHYGENNILRNNILAFAHEGQIIRSRQEDHISFTCENNVVIFDNGRPYGGNWGNGNYVMRNNYYWDTTGLPFSFANELLPDFQTEQKQELGTIVADPKFKDPKNGDFTLLPGSPVAKLVQPTLDIVKTAGLYGAKEWTDKPKAVVFKQVSPHMNPVSKERPNLSMLSEIVINFADSKPGDKCPIGVTNGEDAKYPTSIRVTDEIDGPNGKHALKFVDAPGQPVIWQPHLTFHPNWRRCRLVGEFDVYMNHPQAVLWHEWRDNSAPYKVGPCIRFLGDGTLKHIQKTIGTFPVQTWLHVKITASIIDNAPKTFDLEVTPQGGQTQVYHDLAFGDQIWNQLCWFGFVSESDVKSDFYLANLNFRKEK